MTIADLMKRYGVSSAQGMRQYIRKRLGELNHDGEHARRNADGTWELDEVAVKRLDGLRGGPHVVIVEESAKEKELAAQVETLKTSMLLLQQKLLETQQKLIEAQEQIAEGAGKIALLDAAQKETISLRGELDRERERTTALLSRGLWARIMNRE